jgi:hypothetical protein
MLLLINRKLVYVSCALMLNIMLMSICAKILHFKKGIFFININACTI